MKKKKSFLVSVALLTLLASVTVANGEGRTADTFSVDGKAITYEYEQPFVQMNVDLVPVRDLLIALGVPNDDAHIIWNGEEQSVTAISGKITLKMTLDQVDLYKNGSKAAKFSTAPKMVDGRVYIPVKEVAEALGFKVERDKNGRIISVGSADYIASQQPPDTEAPTLVSARALMGTAVEAVFSEAMDRETAEDPANYKVFHPQTSISVSKAELQPDGRTVRLTVSQQKIGTVYSLEVKNVKDTGGNTIDLSKRSAQFGGVETREERLNGPNLVILTALPRNNSTVYVQFNKELDKETAELARNYSTKAMQTDAEISVLNAKLMKDGKTVRLTTTSQTSGTIYTLTASNIKTTSGLAIKTDDNSFPFGGIAEHVIVPFDSSIPLDPTELQAPNVETAVAIGPLTIDVYFNEELEASSAQNIANYTASISSGSGSYAPMLLEAKLLENQKVVRLNFNWTEEGVIYQLEIKSVRDKNGSIIDQGGKNKVLFAGLYNIAN